MNVWPPIVSVPVRGCVDVLAVALNVTVPLPLPLAPPVTVSQLVSLLTAVQRAPGAGRHARRPRAAAEPTVVLVGESVTVQRDAGLVDREDLAADRQRPGARLRAGDSRPR